MIYIIPVHSLSATDVRTLVNRDIKNYPPLSTQKKSQAIHHIITTSIYKYSWWCYFET